MKTWLYGLLLLLSLTTCVDTIEFTPQAKDDFLVVDARITDREGPHIVKLTRTDVVGRSARFPAEAGAEVVIIENEAITHYLSEVTPGEYHLDEVTGVAGHTYKLRIRLANGHQYESEQEVMPQPLPLSSSFFEFDRNQTLSIFSHVTIPEDMSEGPYLKWQFDHVYQITDLVCNPFDIALTCYFQVPRNNQLLPVLDASKIERGATVQQLISRVGVTGTTFGEKNYFTIVRESITFNALVYWDRISRLISSSGSIFDVPPGGVRSNIRRSDAPDEWVLGYFYAAAEQVEHLPILPSDFAPLRINPYCGAPGFPPVPFPQECCFCTNLVNNRIPRPDYWR